MAGKVKFTSTLTTTWLSATDVDMDRAVLEMATDIDRRAKVLAPVDTGNLVNSSKIKREKQASYSVSFGSSRVPYARIRHEINRKNPQTLRYLERAGDSVARGNVSKYIRKI